MLRNFKSKYICPPQDKWRINISEECLYKQSSVKSIVLKQISDTDTIKRFVYLENDEYISLNSLLIDLKLNVNTEKIFTDCSYTNVSVFLILVFY